METGVNAMGDYLMDLGNDDIEDDPPDNDVDENMVQTIWNYHDNNIPCTEEFIGSGRYSAWTHIMDGDYMEFSLIWRDRDTQPIPKKVDE